MGVWVGQMERSGFYMGLAKGKRSQDLLLTDPHFGSQNPDLSKSLIKAENEITETPVAELETGVWVGQMKRSRFYTVTPKICV